MSKYLFQKGADMKTPLKNFGHDKNSVSCQWTWLKSFVCKSWGTITMLQPSVITASLEPHLFILNPPPTWWVLPPKDLSTPLLLHTSITTFYLTSFFLDCSNFYTHLLWSFHSPNYFYKRSSSRHTFDLVTLLLKIHTQTERHTHLFIQ